MITGTEVTYVLWSLEGIGVGEQDAEVLSQSLRGRLAQAGHLRLLDRAMMSARAQEAGLALSYACSEASCLVELGKELSAQRVIGGSVGKVGRAYSIAVMVVDVETSETVASARWDGIRDIEATLTEGIPEIAQQLIVSLQTEPEESPSETTATEGHVQPRYEGPMAYIPPGLFVFRGQHSDPEAGVTVDLDGFWIDRYEVTNAEFAQFLSAAGDRSARGEIYIDTASPYCMIEAMGAGRFVPRPGYEAHPAEPVTWYGADAYAHWAGKRLPTVAEWEKAARGGLASADSPWGSGPLPLGESGANICGEECVDSLTASARSLRPTDGYPRTAPVGQFEPNQYGLYDIVGNVWEWCSDWASPLEGAARVNPTGPTNGEVKVLAGGSWRDVSTDLTGFPLYVCYPGRPGDVGSVGFRCVKDDDLDSRRVGAPSAGVSSPVRACPGVGCALGMVVVGAGSADSLCHDVLLPSISRQAARFATQGFDSNGFARERDLSGKPGVLVLYVVPNTPAAQGGIVAGDWIRKVNGRSIADLGSFLAESLACQPESGEVRVGYRRVSIDSRWLGLNLRIW